MRKPCLLLLQFIFCINIYAQTVDTTSTIDYTTEDFSCLERFNWVLEQVESNDALFQVNGYANSFEKDVQNYRIYLSDFTGSSWACAEAIQDFLGLQDLSHLSVRSTSFADPKVEETRKTWPKVVVDTLGFKAYLAKQSTPTIEGYWKTPSYVLGIKQKGAEYLVYVIKSSNSIWEANLLKARFKAKSESKNQFTGVIADLIFREQVLDSITLIEPNYLEISKGEYWQRVGAKEEESSQMQLMKRLIPALDTTYQPFNPYRWVSADRSTSILRVSSIQPMVRFSERIEALKSQRIQNEYGSEHIIFDLRSNLDSNTSISTDLPSIYESLEPLLQMAALKKRKPIRTQPFLFYNTSQNREFLDQVVEYNASSKNKVLAWKSILSQEKESNWVQLPSISNKLKLNRQKLSHRPKHISIIIDEGTTAELELLVRALEPQTHVRIWANSFKSKTEAMMFQTMESPDGRLLLSYSTIVRKDIVDKKRKSLSYSLIPERVAYHQVYDYILSRSRKKE